MTTPAANPISLTDVLTELRIDNPGRSAVISLGDADVRNLAGVPAGAISLTNLLNKNSYVPMNVTGNDSTNFASSAGGPGTVSCTPSVSVANGRGPKSYLWTFTSNPSGCTLGDSTSQTCTVSKGFTQNSTGSASAVLNCAVTDSVTTVNRPGINSFLGWEP